LFATVGCCELASNRRQEQTDEEEMQIVCAMLIEFKLKIHN